MFVRAAKTAEDTMLGRFKALKESIMQCYLATAELYIVPKHFS